MARALEVRGVAGWPGLTCLHNRGWSAWAPTPAPKLVVEHLFHDTHAADPAWRNSILRYFNAVGAHPSGEIGEDPAGVPENLLPFVAQVAVGRREFLSVSATTTPPRTAPASATTYTSSTWRGTPQGT